MIDLTQLPEPQLVEINWDNLFRDIRAKYEQIAGITLTKGQVESILLATFCYGGNLLRTNMNDQAKQCLLAFARGNNMLHLAALMGLERLSAAPARTIIRYTFAVPLTYPLLIPAGIRVISRDNATIFKTTQDINAAIGDTYGDASAECIQTGIIGNGYQAGDINQMLDPVAYVSAVENLTITSGGTEEESDSRLQGRIQLAPERFSCAGPAGAYEFWAKTAHPDIVDVAAYSPVPGQVNVAVLLKNGGIPGSDILNLVAAVLNDEKIRPLTDQAVVEAPEVVAYSITAGIYIYKSASALAEQIMEAATQAMATYVENMQAALGKDIVSEQQVGLLQAIPGVYRAVIAPAFVELMENQVAKCDPGDIVLTLAGSVDG